MSGNIVLPGQGDINIERIQQMEAMKMANINKLVVDTGMGIYVQLVSAYRASIGDNKIDLGIVRQIAQEARELGMFYPEALGLITVKQKETPPDAT